MDQLSDSKRLPAGWQGVRWTRWIARLGTAAVLTGGVRLCAVEADRILSYNLGKFLIQPQFDTSAQFTGNLFYGTQNPDPGGPVVLERQIGGVDVPVVVQTQPENGVESDLLWYLSPGMEIQFGTNPENSLNLGYFHDTILYANNEDFNSGQNRLEFNGRFQQGRFTVIGSDRIGWLDTILGGTTSTAQRVPVRRLAWTDNYRTTYDYSLKTDFYTVFNHDLLDYLQSINLYDQATLRGTVGATYKTSERIGIFTELQGGHTDVTANLPPPQQAPGEDSWVYGGFVGARGTFTPRITGSVKIGYETRQFTGIRTGGNGGGVAAGVGVTYSPTDRLLVSLNYDRSVGVSAQFSGQSYVSSVFGIGATQQLGTKGVWSVVGRAGLSFYNYSGLIGLGFGVVETPLGPVRVLFPTDLGRNDQTYSGSLGVVYQPRPWLSSSLTYAFEKYNADFPDPYTELVTGLNQFLVNRVILQVSVGF